jgi:hypothetical protein
MGFPTQFHRTHHYPFPRTSHRTTRHSPKRRPAKFGTEYRFLQDESKVLAQQLVLTGVFGSAGIVSPVYAKNRFIRKMGCSNRCQEIIANAIVPKSDTTAPGINRTTGIYPTSHGFNSYKKL